MGQQKRRRAQPRRGRSGFAARMAAADNYDIICRLCAHGGDIEVGTLRVELSVQSGQSPKCSMWNILLTTKLFPDTEA